MRKAKHWKGLVGLAALVLLLCAAVGGTLAWMTAQSDTVTNTFTPAEVKTEIVETIDGTSKSGIQVKNTGDVEAYVRAAIAMAWVDASGDPVGSSVALPTLPVPSSGWVKGSDGIYYYTQPVAPDGETPALFATAITEPTDKPANCHLQVTVLAEAIQADGVNSEDEYAVVEAWGPVKSVGKDGTLTVTPPNS